MTRKDTTALLREEKSRLNFDGPGDETDRLIIGLDFGTTYSGYINVRSSLVQVLFHLPQERKLIALFCRLAYVFTLKPDQVYTSTDRPVAKGRVVPKALSTMKYSDPDTFQWSYELDRTMKEKIEGIKLLLDPYQEKPLHISLRGDRVQEIR